MKYTGVADIRAHTPDVRPLHERSHCWYFVERINTDGPCNAFENKIDYDKVVSMDKPRHPQVIRTWKVERIRKPSPPKKSLPVKPSKKSKP